MAKTTAGIEKTEHSCADKVTAEISDQVKTNGRTPQTPNISAEKLTVDVNRLEVVLESEKEGRPLLDYGEVGNMNDRILHPPNSNVHLCRTLQLIVNSNKPKNTPESEKVNRPLPDRAANTSFTSITGPEIPQFQGNER